MKRILQVKGKYLEGGNFLAETRAVDKKVRKRTSMQEALQLAEAPG